MHFFYPRLRSHQFPESSVLKLTRAARASLEELRLDYEDYLTRIAEMPPQTDLHITIIRRLLRPHRLMMVFVFLPIVSGEGDVVLGIAEGQNRVKDEG